MAIAFKDFWKLAIDSQLLTLEECKRLNSSFTRVKGAEQGNSVTLAQWLVTGGVISRYQANVLLGGKLRPFVFGEFKVHDRHETAPLKGIYKAVHLPTGHALSLYVLSRALLQDARRLPIIIRQTQTSAAARDEHLSRVFEFVDLGSVKFVVLEDLQGATLAVHLATQRFAPADACRVVRDLSLAAAALHAEGQPHGDIRPQNVWLTPEGGVKLLGFPLARDPAESAQYRAADAEPSARLSAQADYLAPELAHARRAPDAASDVYSLGCLLYELLSGGAPFAGGDVAQKLARHAAEPPVSLEQFGMPPALVQLVAHMMAKNPPVRLASAAQVAASLTRLASPDPVPARANARTLAAYEQTVAQRAVVAASADDRQRGAAVASPGAAIAASGVPAPQVRGGSAAAGAAVRGKRQLGAAPSRGKRRKVSPVIVTLGVFGVFALGAIIAGLGVQAPGPSPKTSEHREDKLAAAASTPLPTAAADKKRSSKKSKPSKPDQGPETAAGEEQLAEVTPRAPRSRRPDKPAVKEVNDDGETLWLSPTDGAPISLNYLPGGAQLFLIIRPAEILESSEGAKIVSGLGPAGQFAKDQIRSITGIDAAQIEQLIIAFYPTEMGLPRAAFVVRLANEAVVETLLTEWKQPAPAEHNGKKYYHSASSAYYLPAEQHGRVIAIMPSPDVEETLDTEGPPSLRKEMEKLLVDSDQRRHFTLLFAPFSLFTDERTLFVGALERLQKPLDRFLGDGIQAALFSFHAGDSFFLEMRAYGQAEQDAFQLAKRYRERLVELPNQVFNYVDTLPRREYSHTILLRFPEMIRKLEEFTRVGEEHRQAVLRSYLPGNAGHNLALGTELALFEQPGAAAAVTVKNPGTKKPATAAEALKLKISLSFPRDTLEKCMEMLGKEIDTEIVIQGADLQLDGITKNQSFSLDDRDKPAEEILRNVLKLANTDGKLVYVVKPKDGGKEAIFITTRTAAAKRGDTLPAELVLGDPPKGK